MNRYRSEDYLYISGYLKSREKYFLNREKTEKMLDSKTPDEAMKVMDELDYDYGSEELSPSEFETMLAYELKATYDFLLPLAPEPEYILVFLYPNDYQNIKLLLKAEFLGISADDYLIGACSIPLDELKAMLRNRSYSEMSTEMAGAVQEAIETYGTTKDPQQIDLILDRACYRDINSELSKHRHDFVRGYFARKIDTINLKSFVRVKGIGKQKEFFSKAFIEGGIVPGELFIENYDESPEQFADKLAIYGLDSFLREGAAMIRETGRFTALERLCDDLLMEYVRAAKYIPYGIEPLISYLVAKESELKTLRIIMTGKLANIPTDIIRKRIRSTYA